MKPLALTDSQMIQVLRAAIPLPPDERGAFLQQVAAELQDQPIGNGLVFRVVREVQQRFLEPPYHRIGGRLPSDSAIQ